VPASRSEHRPRDSVRLAGEIVEEVVDERRLADAGLAGHAYEEPVTAGCGVERAAQFAALLRPADGMALRVDRHAPGFPSGARGGDGCCQRRLDFGRARTEPGILLQHLQNQRIERGGDLRIQARWRVRRVGEDRVQDANLRIGCERTLTRRQLVEDDTERKNIGGGRDRIAARLLR
jgi:hypothetical protein